MQATQEVIINIMQQKQWWKPYEVQQELFKKEIFISDGTLTRQFRRWNYLIHGRKPVTGRTWEYTAW